MIAHSVTCFYFYLWDEDFGPAFIKICAYFPYPAKVWLNGHEWAKQQATTAGIGFTELSNGFATCADPAGLQAICDRLGPGTIQVFFDRWMSVLPLPLTSADRDAGYWWELSMRQVETSRTLVFDAPRHARAFFEALVADNLDIGRPDHVEVIFAGHPRRWGRPPKVEPTYKTRIDTRGHHRGHRERRLQALPGQAVPQGRPGAARRPGSPGALLHRGPLRTVHARSPRTRPKQAAEGGSGRLLQHGVSSPPGAVSGPVAGGVYEVCSVLRAALGVSWWTR